MRKKPTPKAEKVKQSDAFFAETILEPYGVVLQIIFTKDLVGLAYHINVSNPEDVQGRAGFACEGENSKQYVAFDTVGLTYGTIAHEALHCVYNTMRYIGQPLEGGEEAVAYLLQHVFDCCVAAASKKRIKILPL